MSSDYTKEKCIFCKIIAKEALGFIIDEDDLVIVFLSLENHPLIVPKKHLTDIFSLDEDTASLIVKKSIKIARAMREGLPCDGVYVTQTNGACAGQDVFHYHMHLYPKWNDGEAKYRKESKEGLRSRIQFALKSAK